MDIDEEEEEEGEHKFSNNRYGKGIVRNIKCDFFCLWEGVDRNVLSVRKILRTSIWTI